MDAVMQEIIDTHLIKKALYRYPRGIDRLDLGLLESAYHDDAMDFHGVFDGPATEFAEIAMKSQAKEICTSHMLGQSEIEFDGTDVAFVETYFFGTHLRNVKSRDNEPHILFMSGRYADRFDKRDGEWRIGERRVIQDWVHFAKLDDDGLDFAKMFHQPQQSKDDYSYAGRPSSS